MKKLVLLIITLIAVNLTAQQSVVLRYNYKKGDVYEIKMKMTQEMGDVMAQTTNMVMSQKTVAINGDTIVNNTKIEKMSMDMLQGGQIISFDSSKKDDELDEMGKMMKTQMAPLLSVVMTSKLSSLGDLLDTTIEPNIPQAQEMGKQNSSVVYPKEEVKVGSTWSTTKQENGMTVKIDYTVKSISDTEVVLNIGGDVSGMGTGTVSGNMNIDKDSGVPVVSKLEMNLNVQGQNLKIGVSSTIEKH
ncbi:DUF6263 family protein [Polaribacter sp. R77954]|uniref:DUF6263 family protein n=1 Tax=Polaribacter sp. R77954 TaxID=3093870 RepID=UPI0037C6F5E6